MLETLPAADATSFLAAFLASLMRVDETVLPLSSLTVVELFIEPDTSMASATSMSVRPKRASARAATFSCGCPNMCMKYVSCIVYAFRRTRPVVGSTVNSS